MKTNVFSKNKVLVAVLAAVLVCATLVVAFVGSSSAAKTREPDYVIRSYSSHVFDITDVDALYEHVDLVVTGTVVEKMAAEKTEYMPIAYTPGQFTIDNVIKGSVDAETIRILVEGGTITVKEYEDSLNEKQLRSMTKMNLDSLAEKEKATKLIQFKSEYSNDFEENQRYVLFLNKLEETGEYVVVSYSGMIPIEQNSKVTTKADIDQLPLVEKQAD